LTYKIPPQSLLRPPTPTSQKLPFAWLTAPPSHGSRPQNDHRPLLRTHQPVSRTPSPHHLAPAALTIPTIQVLAIGFLLVILSSALWRNYLPLLVVATYVLAPLPNWICGRCSNPDDFMESSGSAVVDFGRFCTGFLVVMGVGKFPYTAGEQIGTSGVTGTLRSDPDSGNGDVDYWGAVDIWDDYQLYNVLSGGAGLLMQHIGLDVGCWLEWVNGYKQEAQ
ncbi:MAG: hypothetical protein Q9198_009636, partial [Flavoplaca austrocitrina]